MCPPWSVRRPTGYYIIWTSGVSEGCNCVLSYQCFDFIPVVAVRLGQLFSCRRLPGFCLLGSTHLFRLERGAGAVSTSAVITYCCNYVDLGFASGRAGCLTDRCLPGRWPWATKGQQFSVAWTVWLQEMHGGDLQAGGEGRHEGKDYPHVFLLPCTHPLFSLDVYSLFLVVRFEVFQLPRGLEVMFLSHSSYPVRSARGVRLIFI